MQKRHEDRALYFEEQSRTSRRYYVPYLRRHGVDFPARVLEIGCGEGGNLLPFAQAGCSVTGMDLCVRRIEQARTCFLQHGFTPRLIVADAVTYEWSGEQFDLILLHDVIEHVTDKEALLRKIRMLLSPGGVVFVGFPAWQMPFGGHQQIARGWLSRCPWIHLLPAALYEKMLRNTGETEETVRELLSIKKTRCPIECFERLMHRLSFRQVDRTLYLINPHYQTKFGWRPVALPPVLAHLPWLRNFCCSGTFYLLKK